MADETPTPYRAFRTGLTFAIVKRLLWVGSDDPKDWRYRRRGTVLGFWHQMKMEMYREYERRFYEQLEATNGQG